MERSDLDGVMPIENASFPTPWPRNVFEEEIDRAFSDARVAVSPEGGEVLGYSVCWIVLDESHLLNIAVRVDVRGSGVGSALLKDCIRRGAMAGAGLIHLEVRAGNQAALRMYEKDGFAFQGIRRRYYADTGEDAILLSRELKESDGS